MSVAFTPMYGPGKPTISFYNIDVIYDFLLQNGMKPFVEIGFMPTPLASGTQICMNYRGNVTPPADQGIFTKHNDRLSRIRNAVSPCHPMTFA